LADNLHQKLEARKIFKELLDGLEFDDGTKISKDDLIINFKKNGSVGRFEGMLNDKYKLNFDLTEWKINGLEFTRSNIRNIGVHEIYGHGIKGYSHKQLHYYAYEAQIMHVSWRTTTTNWKRKPSSNHVFQLKH
jgi:hypothetical protein